MTTLHTCIGSIVLVIVFAVTAGLLQDFNLPSTSLACVAMSIMFAFIAFVSALEHGDRDRDRFSCMKRK